jgi:RNA-directed DNA polymerase
VVINQRPNIDRRQFDQLKAELHDAARNGPAEANRRGVVNFREHLEGRIGWVNELNSTRADRLRKVFDQIAW